MAAILHITNSNTIDFWGDSGHTMFGWPSTNSDSTDKFKGELHIDFYPALTDHDGMGSEEYFRDVFKGTSDSPPSLKGFIVVGDWRAHVQDQE